MRVINQKTIIYIVLIVTAVIALFIYNPFVLYFQNDDMVHIPLSSKGVLLQHNSFRPICDISMMLDYFLWKKNAWGYHLNNLILHIINTALVYILAKKILKKYASVNHINITAFTTAILFWIYMNHSEAVFWIIGRSAMLGMLFFLPACIFYLSREKKGYLFAGIIFSFLAWVTYESTYVIPLLFFIISYIDVKRKSSLFKQEKINVLAVSISFIICLCLRFYFTRNLYTEYEKGNLSGGLITLFGNYARLFMRSWLPPFQNSVVLIATFFIVAFVVFIFIYKNKNQHKILLALFVCFSISLLPYTTLSIDTKGVESERFIYLPSFFVCLIIALLIFQCKTYWQLISALVICVLNSIVLNFHAQQYKFAGSVVQTTINAVNNLSKKQTLIGINIPQENFGALIFRSGFADGINWLKNNGTVDSVTEISQAQTDLPFQKNYPVRYTDNFMLIQDSAITNHLTGNDACLLYTDSVLYVISKHN